MEKKISFKQAIRSQIRAFRLMQGKTPGLFSSMLISALFAALTPYIPIWLSARILDEISGACDARRLWTLVAVTVTATALGALGTAYFEHWKNRRVEWLLLYYKNQMIMDSKVLSMDYAVMDDPKVYDLISQVNQNGNWNSWGVTKAVGDTDRLLRSALRILGAIALTVTLFTSRVPDSAGALTVLNSPWSVLAFFALLSVLTVLAPKFSNKVQEIMVRSGECNRFGNRLFFTAISALDERRTPMDIRIYRQDRIYKSYFSYSLPFMKVLSGWEYSGKMGLYMALSNAVGTIATGLIYVFVCLKAWAGAFGVGAVTQYLGEVTALTVGVSDLLKTYGSIRANAVFLEDLFTLLDTPNKMYMGSLTTEKRSDRKYEIEFRDVSFRYPNTEAWALRHVSMKFEIGRRLALVGQNGSGKTTFIKLLCRLYDPTEGEILLNGIDIRKYDYRDYIDLFSVVFQDFQLLAQRLGENVAGSRQVDRARAEDALVKAGFGERLAEMPDGLDTWLYKEFEPSGVEISGGEAQKIAIARALYRDAPFLILDEPTAALDPIAEAEIYANLDAIVGDKTAIYISHRLSSCRFCDDIAVFDEGQIVQKGNHETLVRDEKGKYFALWSAQAQYYVEKTDV